VTSAAKVCGVTAKVLQKVPVIRAIIAKKSMLYFSRPNLLAYDSSSSYELMFFDITAMLTLLKDHKFYGQYDYSLYLFPHG
jgi:hypothetical protein